MEQNERRDDSVRLVTWGYQLHNNEIEFRINKGEGGLGERSFYSYPKSPDSLWGPSSLASNVYTQHFAAGLQENGRLQNFLM
jgi:hypothetical protein